MVNRLGVGILPDVPSAAAVGTVLGLGRHPFAGPEASYEGKQAIARAAHCASRVCHRPLPTPARKRDERSVQNGGHSMKFPGVAEFLDRMRG